VGKRYNKKYHGNKKQSREVTPSEWEQLVADPVLRDAYTQLVREVHLSQFAAESHSRESGLPLTDTLDLRNAGRVLDQYPQLVRYLDFLRDREAQRQEALVRPDIALSNPTGSYRSDASNALGGWAGSGTFDKNNPIGVKNAKQLREWAESNEWVAAAENMLAEKVARADIAVLPIDERKKYDRRALKDTQLILDQPNELRDTWPMLVGMFVRDLLTLGMGVFTKSMTVGPPRRPTAIYCEDAANIKIYPAWSGDPKEPRYLYQEGVSLSSVSRKVPLLNDEAIVVPYNPASYRFGMGPVQILANTIMADLKATELAKRMADAKPPPTAIQLEGYSADQIKKLRSDYENEVAGRREILFFGGNGPMHVSSLIYSMRDQQFMEWQVYLARKICAVFQISPQDIGLTLDINRATAETQQDISEGKGLLPLLLLIEEYLNREFLADFAPPLPHGRNHLHALNLRVVFPEISEAARQLHAEKAVGMASKSLAGLPSATLNQMLLMYGQEPVSGGNTFYIKTPTGAAPWLSYDEKISGDALPFGTQDPAGGPSDEDAGVNADDSADDDMGDNSSSDASSGSSGGNSDSGDTDTEGSQKSVVARYTRRIDTRSPGKHWSPAAMIVER
jgi:phage portal protein BeeE